MKKKEIVILIVIAAAAFLSLILLSNHHENTVYTGSASGDAVDTFESKSGVTVAIYHRNQIVQVFDPDVDAVYQVDGDVGGLEVEVKDGKWHVINEKCPNHICASMGWMGPDDIIPITCLPNNIMIYPLEKSE